MAASNVSNPNIFIGEGYTIVAVLTNPDGTPRTGLSLRAEMMNSSFTVVSTGTHNATESPNGTYTVEIPGEDLAALNLGATYVPRLYTPASKLLDARGKKVASYRPIG